MKPLLFAASLALLPCTAMAQATVSQMVLLFCTTTGDKQLSLTYAGGDAPRFLYEFGPANAPELSLAVPVADARAADPWPGVGRAITNSVTLENNGYFYTIWISFDRIAENVEPVSGGVTVMQDGKSVASIACIDTPAPVIDSPFGIEDAMNAAGFGFDEERGKWVKLAGN